MGRAVMLIAEVWSERGQAIARQLAEVVPGLWHWHIWDDRIQQETHAHAVSDASGRVLEFDPLPLAPEALRSLEPITAICLTAACHQRSAWRYRRAYGAKVYAPKARARWMKSRTSATAATISCPENSRRSTRRAPGQAHYAFWREQAPSVLFCPDLVMRVERGGLNSFRRSTRGPRGNTGERAAVTRAPV